MSLTRTYSELWRTFFGVSLTWSGWLWRSVMPLHFFWRYYRPLLFSTYIFRWEFKPPPLVTAGQRFCGFNQPFSGVSGFARLQGKEKPWKNWLAGLGRVSSIKVTEMLLICLAYRCERSNVSLTSGGPDGKLIFLLIRMPLRMRCNYIYKENETRSASNWLPVPVWSPSAVQLKPFQAQVRDLLPSGA